MHLNQFTSSMTRDEILNVFTSWKSTKQAEVYIDDSHDEEIVSFLNEFYYNENNHRLLTNPHCLRSTVRSVIRSRDVIIAVSIVKLIRLNIGNVLEGFILCSRIKGVNLAFMSTKAAMLYSMERWPDVDSIFISSCHNYDLPCHAEKQVWHLPVNDLLLIKSGFCTCLPERRVVAREYSRPTTDDFPEMMRLYCDSSVRPPHIRYELDLNVMMDDPYLEMVVARDRGVMLGWACYAKKTFILNSYLIREYQFYVGGWSKPDHIFGGVDCDVITFHGKPLDKTYLLRGVQVVKHFWINRARATSNLVSIA